MNHFHTEEIQKILTAVSGGQLPPELPGMIYALGRDAETDEEYDYAVSTLFQLADHPSPYVLSLVILAFSLLAVFHGHLDRERVESIIRRGWALASGLDQSRVQDAVDDINFALGWDLAL